MKRSIRNINSLDEEVVRLKALAKEQEGYLGDQYDLLNQKVSKPIRVVSSFFGKFPGLKTVQSLLPDGTVAKKEGIVAKVIRFIVPFIVNRIFLRKAGFIKRGAFTLLANQVAGFIASGQLVSVVSGLASSIRPKKKTVKQKFKDAVYNMPPDSETY